MKLTIALIAAARANKVARQADDSDRRYSQLVDMMSHYNPSFDERKYWAYGCNCLILGKFNHKKAILSKNLKFQIKVSFEIFNFCFR